MLEADHVVDIWEKREQVPFNAGHCMLNDARDALNRGGDGEDVAGSDRSVCIAVAHEGMTLDWRLLECGLTPLRQAIKAACGRDANHGFFDP